MSITVNLEIYSRRWGRDDTYSVELNRDFMEISLHARTARATWRDNQDPEWSGQSIRDIMENDNIYPPAITQDLFEHAWQEWRNGELNDQQVAVEFKEIATWLNTVTKAKPQTDFWRKFF